MSCFKHINKKLDNLSILQWNIRGFTSTDAAVAIIKQDSLTSISNDIQPDIICFQEGRVHYQWKQDNIQHNKNNVTKPPEIPNHFCYISFGFINCFRWFSK